MMLDVVAMTQPDHDSGHLVVGVVSLDLLVPAEPAGKSDELAALDELVGVRAAIRFAALIGGEVSVGDAHGRDSAPLARSLSRTFGTGHLKPCVVMTGQAVSQSCQQASRSSTTSALRRRISA